MAASMKLTMAFILILVGVGFGVAAFVEYTQYVQGAAQRIRIGFSVSHARAQLENDRLEIENLELEEKIDRLKGKAHDPRPLLIARSKILTDKMEIENADMEQAMVQNEDIAGELTKAGSAVAACLTGIIVFFLPSRPEQNA